MTFESEKRSFDISVVLCVCFIWHPRHLGFRTRTTDPNRRSRFYFISLFTPIYAFFINLGTVRKQIWGTSPRRRSKCWRRSSRSLIPPTTTPLNESNPVSPTSKPKNTCQSFSFKYILVYLNKILLVNDVKYYLYYTYFPRVLRFYFWGPFKFPHRIVLIKVIKS